MHHPEQWPPSEKIHPLFVAFHINELAKDTLLSNESIAYLKAHEPIGCRDTHTTDMLKAKGVKAYFFRLHDRDMYLGVKEITVIDYIWAAIIEVVRVMAEAYSFDEDEVMLKIIADSRKLALFSQLAEVA